MSVVFVLAVILMLGLSRRHLDHLTGAHVHKHLLDGVVLDYLDIVSDDFAVLILDTGVDRLAAGVLFGCRDRLHERGLRVLYGGSFLPLVVVVCTVSGESGGSATETNSYGQDGRNDLDLNMVISFC